jgi:hypothetical protein
MVENFERFVICNGSSISEGIQTIVFIDFGALESQKFFAESLAVLKTIVFIDFDALEPQKFFAESLAVLKHRIHQF